MKKILSLLALLIAAPALSQPGPGPTPNPWLTNGAQIYYNQGCVTVTTGGVAGTCHGAGSITAVGAFLTTLQTSGTATFQAAVAMSPATGLVSIGPTTTGSINNMAIGATTRSTVAGTTGNFNSTLTVSAGGALVTGNSTVTGTFGVSGNTTIGTGLATTILLNGNTTGVAPGITFGGETNTGGNFTTTGSGVFGFYTDAFAVKQVEISRTASANRYLKLTGSNGGNPTIDVSAGSLAITPATVFAGQVTSSVTTGTAPFVVASTTNVANLNASTLTGSAVGTNGATIGLLNTANTYSAKQLFNGSTSVAAVGVTNIVEPSTISATAATGTINYDLSTQSILYYTTNASANWTTNFRWSSGTAANAAMATGDIVTAVFMVTQGASPFYNNVINVDGSAVTPKWQGGTAPSAGNASGIDVYTYSIIKTGSAAFTILASQTQYK